MIVIDFFNECLSPDAGYSHLNWDHCFSAVGESEGRLSYWCSRYCLVGSQYIGQFFWPGTFRIVQLRFNNLEQHSICHLRLSIRLWMTWGQELILDA
nr:hypothetical protein CFP56_10886 [Quercus suber]